MKNLYILAFAAVSLLAVPLRAQTTIGPGGMGDEAGFVLNSNNGTRYIGQTITSPGDGLTQFTINIASITTPGNVQFGFAPLITNTTVGAPLYTSGNVAATTGVNTFSGFSIPTTAGQRYLAYVTNYMVANGASGVTFYDYNGTDPYPNGTLAYANGNNAVTASTFTVSPLFDAAFTATFSPAAPAPEPVTWTLMIAGFGAVGGMLRRKVRATGTARRAFA